MGSRRASLAIAAVAAAALLVGVRPALGAENIRQYRAALTGMFLWKYSAIPVFVLNPLYPGDVVQLKNETKYLSYDRCYRNMTGSHYRQLEDYADGTTITTDVDLKIAGELLTAKLAKIDAEGKAAFESTTLIKLSPISVDVARPDVAALRHVTGGPDCQLIPEIMDGRGGGFALVANVLQGRVNLLLSAKMSGSLSVEAKGELAKLLAKSFGITEAAITVSGDMVTFSVSESPAPKTLGFVPANLSRDELARVTLFLEGKRGADLEIAVHEALREPGFGPSSKLWILIQSLLGDEIRNKEHWAENFLKGEHVMTAEEVRRLGPKEVDFAKVATYAAAMELVRFEAPLRPQ